MPRPFRINHRNRKVHSYSVTLTLFIIFSIHSIIIAENIRNIQILQTTDIHSHVFDKDGGWIKLASLIKKARENGGGKKRTLLIDCGDTLVGSTSSFIDDGYIPASMLNYLNYDAWIIGNHDFELGSEKLLSICHFIRADKLVGNLNWHKEIIKSWKIYRKNGAKIAVIGLTSPHIAKWLWGKDVERFKVQNILSSLNTIIPEVMRSKPDMIILAIHHGRFSPPRLNGINLSKIANLYPQIDLILGGHTHLNVPGERIGINSWYVIPGAHAEKLAQINVQIDIDKHKVVNITSKLLSVTPTTPEDLEISAKLQKSKNKVMRFNRKKVGYIKSTNSDYINNLFGKALCNASNPKGAFISPPVKPPKLSGLINEKELFSIEPYIDIVSTIDITRNEFISIWEEQQNCRYKNKRQKLFNIKVEKMNNGQYKIYFKDGKEWQSTEQRVPIAFSSYILAGAGGRFPILKLIASKSSSNGKSFNITMKDALRMLIKQSLKKRE